MERIDQYPTQDPTTTESATGAVGTVLDEAKDQARSVADTAVAQTKSVFASIGSDLSTEAHSQKQRMAKGLDDFSTELDDVALKGTGRVPSLAGEAADRTRTLSRWLENTEASDMLASVEDFGRRRPAMFILGSVAAGLAVGRLTRGMIDERTASNADADTSTDYADIQTPTPLGYPTLTTPVTPVTPVPVTTYGSL